MTGSYRVPAPAVKRSETETRSNASVDRDRNKKGRQCRPEAGEEGKRRMERPLKPE